MIIDVSFSPGDGPRIDDEKWPCVACTFLNPDGESSCKICSTPKRTQPRTDCTDEKIEANNNGTKRTHKKNDRSRSKSPEPEGTPRNWQFKRAVGTYFKTYPDQPSVQFYTLLSSINHNAQPKFTKQEALEAIDFMSIRTENWVMSHDGDVWNLNM